MSGSQDSNDSNEKTVELNLLNDFYSFVQRQEKKDDTNDDVHMADEETQTTTSIENKVIDSYVKSALYAAVRPKNNTLAITILEHLYTNEYILQNEQRLSTQFAANLNKEFFDRLLKIFQNDKQTFALKLAKILILLLRKTLHQNLSIVNPFLQIMELGFKHSDNEIKQDAYKCWKGLISNFALDKSFFFKPKKFNLILTPLINKCKGYKDASLCLTKASAWLCLIENINEKLPEYTSKALIPFFNYCFSVSDKTVDQDDSKGIDITFAELHNFESLTQIGFELFISIVHNGDMTLLDAESQKKLKHVSPNCYYKIKNTLSTTATWIYMIRYFFSYILKKPFLDSKLIAQVWKKLFELFKLTPTEVHDKRNEFLEEMDDESQTYARLDMTQIVEFFIKNTIEYINKYLVSSKQTENKFLSQVVNQLFIALRMKKNSYLFENEKLLQVIDFLTMFKKSSNLVLNSDEEDENVYLKSLGNMLALFDHLPKMLDLYSWLHLSAKFYEHLRHLKTKTTMINLTEESYETIQTFIMFPFKYFTKLNIQENDIKLVINSLSNVAKSYTALIKQNRITIQNDRIDDADTAKEEFNVNKWCIDIFHNLRVDYEDQQSHVTPDNMIKLVYMHTQLNHFIMQNIFEFDLVNQITEEQQMSTEMFNSDNNKKHGDSYQFFSCLVMLVQQLVASLYDVILNKESSNKTGTLIKKDFSDSPSLIENKQPIQIFCSLVDLISILFTRVKSHNILSQFLTNFPTSIEYLTELNSISKISTNTEASPNAKKAARLSHPYNQHQISSVISFQATRHSNDIFDKFSMQIASYIQNHLIKSFSNHQFDSTLLKTLEPIFFSFLKYSQKVNLKQKTLQAWNNTFGKSTVNSLVYTPRIEQLFVEIRDEMQNNTSRLSSSTNGSGSQKSLGLVALSLPGFKLIDPQHQTNLTNSFMNEVDGYLMSEEKENTPESSKLCKNANDRKSLQGSKSKEFLNETSCSSVPVAHLLTTTNKSSPSFANTSITQKTPPAMETIKKSERLSLSAPKGKKQADLLREVQKNNSTSVTANFCFSGASGISSSTSKLNNNLMRTPDASTHGVRSSPRSLRNNNSKRKLDLNVLIDQMPDKDFIEINKKVNNIDDENVINVMNKLDKSAEKSQKNKNKQPLTEHQKEMRKKKSFIPMEIQSVCCVLEPTMDSQMSCTNDTNFHEPKIAPTCLNFDNKPEPPSFAASLVIQKPEEIKEDCNESKNQMDMSVTESDMPATTQPQDDDEDFLIANMSTNVLNASKTNDNKQLNSEVKVMVIPVNSFDAPSRSPTSSNSPTKFINFKSKIKPNKKIELVEVKNSVAVNEEADETDSSPKDTSPKEEVVSVPEVTNEICEVVKESVEDSKTQEADNKEEKTLEVEDSSNRRRSSRLKVKVEAPAPLVKEKPEESTEVKIETTKTDIKTMEFSMSQEVTESVTDLVSHLVTSVDEAPEINETELLEKLNEECKDSKANLKSLKLNVKRKMKKALKGSEDSNELMKINHKHSKGKIVKSTFKTHQDKLKLAKKQKKYKQLIKGLKYNQKPSKSKVDKTELLNELNRSLNEEESTPTQTAEAVKDVYEFEDVNPESIEESDSSEEDDDDMLLIALVDKDTENTNDTKNTAQAETKPIPQVIEPEPAAATKPDQLKPEKLAGIAEESTDPATPIPKQQQNISNSILAKSLNTSPSTAALIQKSNGTPTTSILKKRLIEAKINNSASKKMINISAAALFADTDNTPNKRRVSFCESVQIEEIEPNFNKSLFRSTPKPQNRAKLVLSSYFNNKQNTSPSMAQSNSAKQTTAAQLPQTHEAKLNCSLNTATSSMSPKLSTSLNQMASQFKMNSNRLSMCESQLPSNNMNSSPGLNCPGSPGSSSLINFFSNNKQNFLSQRSSIIQQKIGNQRVIPQNFQRPTASPQVSNTSSPVTSSVLPSKFSSSSTTASPAPQSITKTGELYSKLKDSTANIEKFELEMALQKLWFNINWQTALNLKGIFTIGDLCSINLSDINSLPFRVPKMENFLCFIKKFEEQTKEQTTDSTKSPKPKKLLSMGSVEEEMDKLETSIVLDTSIESEPVINEKKTAETSGMDVDLDASSHAPKQNNLTVVSDRLKTFVSARSASFKIDETLNVTEVLKLLDEADSIESTVLRELQLKLSRLSEARKKLRKHAEASISSLNM